MSRTARSPRFQTAEPRTRTTRLKENRTHHTISELRHLAWSDKQYPSSKKSQDAPRWTDGTARRQEEPARATGLERESLSLRARDREKENDQGKGIVYLQHSGVVAVPWRTGHQGGGKTAGGSFGFAHPRAVQAKGALRVPACLLKRRIA